MAKTFSFWQAAWRRLKKNMGAMIGLAVIVFTILVAILAYWVSPDRSPYANRMIVEISGLKPGTEMQFLKVKKEKKVEETGILEKTIHGNPDQFDFLPISGHQVKTDSLVFYKYLDEGVSERSALYQNSNSRDSVQIIERTFWLGTDKYGRDILSRLIVGTRVSLSVGFIAVLISLTIGVVLGAVAGYFRGWADDVIMWLINVVWSIPTLLLVFAMTLVLGKGFWQVFIAVGLTMWVSVARIIRGQVLSIRELEYIEAAKALGFSHMRTIVRHILPNVLGPVMVIAASNFATAIVIEAGLSFLGVGVQAPQPSWGLMIKENYNFIITHNPMLAIIPGMAIMLLVLSFNLLGNGLRDALDVKGRI
jgi:ABC-type dipeptide/oligopeptide/nickel transport system permease subunit